jgi:uncharacterized protein YgfB (UPF0149 family)
VNNITYPDLARLLIRHDADLDAAEAHGIATGMLCLDGRIAADTWLSELFQHSPALAGVERDVLFALFERTRECLLSLGFEFDLFLPDDEALLSQQLEALSNWCRGFLFGLGFSSASAQASWPGDSGEILKDFIELTKLDTHAYTEGDEQAFMEIHEYCRAAIMLLKDDLHGTNHQFQG